MLANVFGPEFMIVLVIAVIVLFGAGQLPKIARSVGEASKEFKKVQEENEKSSSTVAAAADERVTTSDEKVTMTKAELDALLAEREARVKRETPPIT